MPANDFSGDNIKQTTTTEGSQLSSHVLDSIRTGALSGFTKGLGEYAAKALESGATSLDFTAPIGHINFDKGTMTPERQAEIDKAKIKEGDKDDIKENIKDMKGHVVAMQEGSLTGDELKEALKGMHGFPKKDGGTTEDDLKEKLKHMKGFPTKDADPNDPDLKEKLKHMQGHPAKETQDPPEKHDSKK